MPCLCPSDTLRLFVRSVTCLDILSSSTHSFSNTKRVAGRLASTRRLQTRCILPIRTAPLSRQPTDCEQGPRISSSPSRQLRTTARQWQQEPAVQPPSAGNGAILELSTENIDALLSELEEHPSAMKPTDGYKSSRRLARDVPAGVKIRRTRVENTELSIHYSSPRAPPKSAPPQDIDSKKKEPRTKGYNISQPYEREAWQTQKEALKKKFPDGWMPQKRLSPDALTGIRALHAQEPEKYTTKLLAESFEISPEGIRRILKSKWVPDAEEESDRTRRWLKRGQEVWSRKAELGVKPPRMWREMGIGSRKPEWKKYKQPEHVMPPLITTSRRTGAIKPDTE